MRLVYISHPEVAVDPATPPPDWGLSPRGIARATAFAMRTKPVAPCRLIASAERKAQDTAFILGYHWGLRWETRPDMNEVDRSATGYVPHAQHEALANQLFARPTESAAGWERAADAQVRMMRAWQGLRAHEDVILIGHGAVGSLLWCALCQIPINRQTDQPGQGCVWHMDFEGGTEPPRPWRRFEEVTL